MAALASALGFLGGAMFWHAVGFWAFMSDVVLDSTDANAVSAQAALPGDMMLVTGSLPTIYLVDPRSCTSLELDRQANRTVLRPCPGDGLALRLEVDDDREDLAAASPGSDVR
jgi:hypothetical protein